MHAKIGEFFKPWRRPPAPASIGAFSQALNQNQLRSLRASRSRETGQLIAPSESTIRRVLQRLDPGPLDRIVNDWLRSHLQELALSALAVDGKCVRTAAKIQGQSLQLFGALDTQTQLVCRQIPIPPRPRRFPASKTCSRIWTCAALWSRPMPCRRKPPARLTWWK